MLAWSFRISDVAFCAVFEPGSCLCTPPAPTPTLRTRSKLRTQHPLGFSYRFTLCCVCVCVCVLCVCACVCVFRSVDMRRTATTSTGATRHLLTSTHQATTTTTTTTRTAATAVSCAVWCGVVWRPMIVPGLLICFDHFFLRRVRVVVASVRPCTCACARAFDHAVTRRYNIHAVCLPRFGTCSAHSPVPALPRLATLQEPKLSLRAGALRSCCCCCCLHPLAHFFSAAAPGARATSAVLACLRCNTVAFGIYFFACGGMVCVRVRVCVCARSRRC